jgi:hypothetical protein
MASPSAQQQGERGETMSDKLQEMLERITPEQAKEFLNDIHQQLDTRAKLQQKTNDELALLLLSHVWAFMPAGPKAELVDECIDRLLSPEGKAALEASDD